MTKTEWVATQTKKDMVLAKQSGMILDVDSDVTELIKDNAALWDEVVNACERDGVLRSMDDHPPKDERCEYVSITVAIKRRSGGTAKAYYDSKLARWSYAQTINNVVIKDYIGWRPLKEGE